MRRRRGSHRHQGAARCLRRHHRSTPLRARHRGGIIQHLRRRAALRGRHRGSDHVGRRQVLRGRRVRRLRGGARGQAVQPQRPLHRVLGSPRRLIHRRQQLGRRHHDRHLVQRDGLGRQRHDRRDRT